LFLILLSACGQGEETSSQPKEKKELETTQQKNTPEKEDPIPEEWPRAYRITEDSFLFPSSLQEAEEALPGKWWDKETDLSESEKEQLYKEMKNIDQKNASNNLKASNINNLLFQTLHPHLPGLSSFQPRGKITLEDLNTGSGLKLNGQEVKENINVAIILDASGSMKAVQEGQTQMEIAKVAIDNFVANLPENTNVSLTIYGHEGSSSDREKEMSCKSIKEVYPLQRYKQSEFESALSEANPSGWTPIADSLKKVGKSLENFNSETNTNVIYLVSDGEETCDGDPSSVAKELVTTNIKPIINVIGFSVKDDQREQLEKIASESNGRYIQANNRLELVNEFNRSNKAFLQWISWRNQHTLDAIKQKNKDNLELIDLKNTTNLRLIKYKNTVNQLLIAAKNKHDLNEEVFQIALAEMEEYFSDMVEELETDFKRKLDQIESTYSETQKEIDKTYDENKEE
jgi:Ca-activated chloride channel homolog